MPVRGRSTDGSIDDPICSQPGNLTGTEPELAEDFVGMLSQVRRMRQSSGSVRENRAGDLTPRTRPARGCSYSKNVSFATNCGSVQIES